MGCDYTWVVIMKIIVSKEFLWFHEQDLVKTIKIL